jgi:hypothetical protein
MCNFCAAHYEVINGIPGRKLICGSPERWGAFLLFGL